MSCSSEAARASCSSATRSAVLANRSRVASCIFERLLLRGDRTRRLLLRDLGEQPADLGTGGKAELVPAQERLRPPRSAPPPPPPPPPLPARGNRAGAGPRARAARGSGGRRRR